MSLITEDTLELQKDLHARYEYGKGVDAKECASLIRGMFDPGTIVLDYGCGQSHALFNRLNPTYPVWQYDPAIPGYDKPPHRLFPVVVCADVMEHVERECLEDVLAHIRALTRTMAIFVIATRPSNKIMADGRGAHIIVEKFDFWVEKIGEKFRRCVFIDRDMDGKGVLILAQP